VSSQFQLMRERRFRPFFTVAFLGAFNDNAFKTALITLVTFRAGQLTTLSPRTLATLLPGLFILPFFLLSATSGQVADRMEKGRLTRWVKLFEIAIMLLASWGFLGNRLWPLVAALALMGVHSTVFGPVKYAYLPQHLDPHELVGGNGMMEMGTFVAILLGEVLGAALATLPHGGWYTSATLVVIAVLGYGASRGVPHSPAADPELRISWNLFAETARNLRFARGNRVVWLSLMGISWFWFFGATLLAQFPSFAREVLGGDERVFILLLTVFSLGIGAGSLLCEKLSGRKVEIGLVPFGALGLTVFGADLYLASRGLAPGGAPIGVLAFLGAVGHGRLLADCLLIGLFGGFYIVPLYALIQTRSEKSHQSRIIAANNILNSLFMVLSALITMVLFRLGLTIPQLFLATALFNLVVAVYIVALVPEFLIRFLSWVLVHTVYRLRLENAARIPEEGPAMLVSNFLSYVDALVILAASPRPIRFVLDRHLFQKPGLGFLLRLMRAIPSGGSLADLEAARAAVLRALGEGELVAVFPEGRPGAEGQLGAFEAPFEEMLGETRVTILPVGLAGLRGSVFSRAPEPRPAGAWLARVSLRVGAPLPPAPAPGAVRAAIQGLL
jgi:1-acyl-sn-glycerol-3-phosphate acyltransferase/MFS family permease